MTPRSAGLSASRRWLALLSAIALLTLAWWPAIPPLDDRRVPPDAMPMPRDAPLGHAADCMDCQAAWPLKRGHARVHALAPCGACHAPDARSDGSAPMLAQSRIDRLGMPGLGAPPVDDEFQVRAGGAVYQHACTRCHERDRQAAASGELRSVAMSIDAAARRESTGAALDAPLSDERMAALAAFLRRHAGALPWSDVVRTAHVAGG